MTNVSTGPELTDLRHTTPQPSTSPGRGWLITGALLAALAVLTDAFAAHGLRAVLEPAQLATWQTAARYQFLHAFALLVVGVLAARLPGRWLSAAGACFALGTVLFCGSLYVLALTRLRALGMLAPVGGLAFVAGWLCLAVSAWRARTVQAS
jgi:uncharacterized membrane protein YgdD (TMEM256/DUF423 family)